MQSDMKDVRKLTIVQNSVFNAVGSIFYSVCQWAITMVAVRLSSSFDNSGIFQLAVSITNIFFTIACFVPRSVQVTDLRSEYSEGEYIGMRFLSSGISLLLCLVYSFVSGYRGVLLISVNLYMVFKIGEAISDEFRTFAQINGRMDYEFWSFFIRGVVSIASFTGILAFSKSIILAIAGMTLCSGVVVATYDCSVAKKFVKMQPALNRKNLLRAFKLCFPTVFSSLAIVAFVTVPRQIFQKITGTELFGIYATIATPVVFIQLLATSLFNPMLSTITEIYYSGDGRGMKQFLLRIVLGISFLLLLSLAGAKLCGEYIYVFLFGETIRPYYYLIYPVIICAILYSICYIESCIMIIIRKQREMIIISILGIISAAASTKQMISHFGMNGVSCSIIIAYLVFLILCMVRIKRNIDDSEWKDKQTQ